MGLIDKTDSPFGRYNSSFGRLRSCRYVTLPEDSRFRVFITFVLNENGTAEMIERFENLLNPSRFPVKPDAWDSLERAAAAEDFSAYSQGEPAPGAAPSLTVEFDNPASGEASLIFSKALSGEPGEKAGLEKFLPDIISAVKSSAAQEPVPVPPELRAQMTMLVYAGPEFFNKNSSDQPFNGVYAGPAVPPPPAFIPNTPETAPVYAGPEYFNGTESPAGAFMPEEPEKPYPWNQSVTDTENTCRSCGARLMPDALFCPECGTLRERFCPSCGAPVKGGKFCPECGGRLDD